MTPSPIAVAADYAEALLAARRAKNALVLVAALVLLGEIAVFLTARYGIHLSESGADQTPHIELLNTGMKHLLGLMVFLGVSVPVILAMVLMLIVAIMVVGRLIGVSALVYAFVWCVVLEVIVFPWQMLMLTQSPGFAEFDIPGALYNWTELLARAREPNSLLLWARFVVGPLVALVVLMRIYWLSRRGMRLALGEAAPEAIPPAPAAATGS